MDGLQKSFVEPMEAYTRAEYGKLADNKKAWEATEEVYVAVSAGWPGGRGGRTHAERGLRSRGNR